MKLSSMRAYPTAFAAAVAVGAFTGNQHQHLVGPVEALQIKRLVSTLSAGSSTGEGQVSLGEPPIIRSPGGEIPPIADLIMD